MSDVIKGRILRGVETSSLTEEALFDRIINLKAIRESGKSFIIRSDYEILNKDGNRYFSRCVYKPDIKITYMQVSNTTTIKISIEVVNFYIPAEKGAHSILSNREDPVVKMHVYMGYINQFYNWGNADLNEDGVLASFYNMGRESQLSDNYLSIDILDSYTKSLPPDQTTVFNGVVGSVEYGLKRKNVSYLGDGVYGSIDFPDGFTQIEKVFFELITSRFVSSKYNSRVVSDADETRLEIYDYDYYKGKTTLEEQEKLSIQDRWVEVQLENGIMSKEDALIFGITCSVSRSLREWSEKYMHSNDTFEYMLDCISQIYVIKSNIHDLRWFVQIDGSLMFYMNKDSIDEVVTGSLGEKVREMNRVILPAIYNLTYHGIRKINTPFFKFLQPLQTVGFSSRYFISNISGFFTKQDEGLAWFTILYSKIVFATVQDHNTVQLVCADSPFSGEAVEEEVEETEETEKQNIRNSNWVRTLIKISKWTGFGDKEAIGSWSQVAIHYMLSMKAEEEKDWKPTMIEALTDLVSWNSELNSQNTEKYGITNEGTKAYPEVKPPLATLMPGDEVLVKIPYRRESSYIGDGVT